MQNESNIFLLRGCEVLTLLNSEFIFLFQFKGDCFTIPITLRNCSSPLCRSSNSGTYIFIATPGNENKSNIHIIDVEFRILPACSQG